MFWLLASLFPGALYPWFSGDGSGVVDCLAKAGFVGPCAEDAADGRVPMGATVLPVGLPLWGELPPGEELLVRFTWCAAVPSKGPLVPGGLD